MPVSIPRLLHIWAKAAMSPREDVSRIERRVRLRWVDLYLHMNYASYLEVMEEGRWDWAFRSRAAQQVFRTYRPVVVDVQISYRRELKPGARFSLDTRLVAIDGKRARTEQVFLVEDRVHARATVDVLLLHKGRVAAEDVVAEKMKPWVVAPF